MFLDEFTQVDESIAHAPQGGIYGYVCLLGNLAECEVLVEVHDDNLALTLGQIGQQAAKSLDVLLLDDLGLKRALAVSQAVGNVAREVFAGYCMNLFFVAQLVNDEVMCYAYEPGTELTSGLVLVAADGDDGPREGLLEDVFSTVFTMNDKGYVGIYIINKVMNIGTERISNFNGKFITILAILAVIYISIVHFRLFNPYNDKLIYYISFLSYIIIGHFLAKSDFLGKRIDKKYLIIATGLLFLGSYLWYILSFVVPRTHMAHVFVTLGYFNLLILFMSLNAFLFFKYLSKSGKFEDIENKTLGKLFTTISNYSYGIYLIHYLVLARLKINLIRYVNFTQGSSLIWIPVLVIATTAISLAILAILDRIPYLDKVTGKK